MAACAMRPDDKKVMMDRVGKDLVARHGKQRYYQPAKIRESASRAGYDVDVHCWAMVMFSSPTDFRLMHEAAGEACDYVEMKAELLSDLAGGAGGFAFPDLGLSWLEWPDIDLSGMFDWFDFT